MDVLVGFANKLLADLARFRLFCFTTSAASVNMMSFADSKVKSKLIHIFRQPHIKGRHA